MALFHFQIYEVLKTNHYLRLNPTKIKTLFVYLTFLIFDLLILVNIYHIIIVNFITF